MEEKRKTPIKAIRAFCLECCGGSSRDVKYCTGKTCALYDYRLGHNPNIKREMTEEQRQAARDRLAKSREAKSDGDSNTTNSAD